MEQVLGRTAKNGMPMVNEIFFRWRRELSYDRMKAKKIKGEHCRFCGDSKVALVKTVCCEQWICCDTAAFSFRGGGYCQDYHERNSLCYEHNTEGHAGHFKDCTECEKHLSRREYEEYLSDSTNYPAYSKPCDQLSATIRRALKNI
jgi:hypothetical protein